MSETAKQRLILLIITHIKPSVIKKEKSLLNSNLLCNCFKFCVIVFIFILKKVCLFGLITGRLTSSMFMFVESNVILQKHIQ